MQPSLLILGAPACRRDLLQRLAVLEQLAAKAPTVHVADPRYGCPSEGREDVLLEPPEIVLVSALGERSLADLTDTPTLQPVGGVLVHRDPGGVLVLVVGGLGLIARKHLLNRDAGAQLREDHLKLVASPSLCPTVNVAAEHDGIALSLVPKPDTDARCSVPELPHFDAAASRAWHHALLSRLEDDMIPLAWDS
ncbi:MAG: hypothetical protein WBV85_07795 [Solirubrobacteraceae bacterium]